MVCVLTGHGLKDPDRAVAVGGEMQSVEATLDWRRAASWTGR